MRTTFRSSGMGSGRGDAIGTALNSSPRLSIRTSPLRRARLRASQANGCLITSSTSRTRNPPLARWSAPDLISRKSVLIAPNVARYSMRPSRL